MAGCRGAALCPEDQEEEWCAGLASTGLRWPLLALLQQEQAATLQGTGSWDSGAF